MNENNNAPVKLETTKDIGNLIGLFTNLSKTSDKETALSYAINAQLQLLKAIDSTRLSSGLFNVMIESLNQSLRICNDENQKDFIQNKACLMVASFLYFKEAKWRYEVKEDEEEGEKTLRQASELLVDTVCAIAAAYTGNTELVNLSVDELCVDLKKDKGFFIKILDIITGEAEEKAKKEEREYYLFIQSAFEKLYKYQSLFGKSSILANIAKDYKDDIAEFHKPFPPVCTNGIKGILIGVGISELVFFIVVGVMALINLIPKVNWTGVRLTCKKYNSKIDEVN